MNPLLLQVGIAGPPVFALAIYAASRREQGPVHRHLAALLLMILAWMIGMVAYSYESETARAWAAVLLIPPSVAMSPAFFLMMAHYAGVQVFALHRAATWALLAPFALFFVAFATNPLHGLMLRPDADLLSFDLLADSGPLFYPFQFWANATAVAGLAISLRIALTSRSRSERRRMGLLVAAATLPLIAHAAYLTHAIPLDYPLTPASLGITALLVVAAIQKYSLLEMQPVARRDVIEASSDGVLMADFEERIVDLNPAALGILSCSHDELIGAELGVGMARLGPLEPASAVDDLLAALRAGRVPVQFEVETASGQVLEIAAGSPSDAVGARAGHFVVLRDRTKERRAERMLYQSQKLESVGILAAGVAHEVNNPLAFVRANLTHIEHLVGLVDDEKERLPKELAGEIGELRAIIDESLGGLDRIHRIVQRLLRFSRMPTGRRADCDVNAALEEATRFASLDRGAGARLEAELAQDLPCVDASPDELVQVFLNLFINAKHALADRPDGCIKASTGVRGAQVVVCIEDDGPGVPEALSGKIFDPFFTTRAPGEGTGLGLSIAYDIVRDHGGSLELEPVPEGGARFVVRLPVAAG